MCPWLNFLVEINKKNSLKKCQRKTRQNWLGWEFSTPPNAVKICRGLYTTFSFICKKFEGQRKGQLFLFRPHFRIFHNMNQAWNFHPDWPGFPYQPVQIWQLVLALLVTFMLFGALLCYVSYIYSKDRQKRQKILEKKLQYALHILRQENSHHLREV